MYQPVAGVAGSDALIVGAVLSIDTDTVPPSGVYEIAFLTRFATARSSISPSTAAGGTAWPSKTPCASISNITPSKPATCCGERARRPG